jgi:SulP family sulfate permease
MMDRILFYMRPIDGRYEDLKKGDWRLNVLRDFIAGLIVSMIAIPMAMGFAMASGLRPEQGIVGGAVAGLLGALFGGSKYQVYGPTAAFIPIIAALMAKHGYNVLIIASILAGVILMVMGVARLGALVAKVPHSIVVGFTIGIAVVIATSQLGEVLGISAKLGGSLPEKLMGVAAHIDQFNIFALGIALLTFALIKILLKVSVYIPAPLIAIGAGTVLSATVLSHAGLASISDRYGSIPTTLLKFTPPTMPAWSAELALDLCYYVLAIVFVAAVESLLCSRMADRLAGNKGIPYNPNKELWGQGVVNIFVVLLNGFPHTGALARTATNIKLGALSPLAGIFKFALKLLLAVYLARFLEMVPMACIGGILLFVSTAMVKGEEVREAWALAKLDRFLLIWTAVMVVMTDFLVGVLSALFIYGMVVYLAGTRSALPFSAQRFMATLLDVPRTPEEEKELEGFLSDEVAAEEQQKAS